MSSLLCTPLLGKSYVPWRSDVFQYALVQSFGTSIQNTVLKILVTFCFGVQILQISCFLSVISQTPSLHTCSCPELFGWAVWALPCLQERLIHFLGLCFIQIILGLPQDISQLCNFLFKIQWVEALSCCSCLLKHELVAVDFSRIWFLLTKAIQKKHVLSLSLSLHWNVYQSLILLVFLQSQLLILPGMFSVTE